MLGKFSVILNSSQTNHFSSHYVAFIRKELPDDKSKSWVLYNDEKVVKANDVEEMKKFAYVYFFKRV
jgi:ubiquitin carboxyl-terminal hydrolase 5/13